ncbi:MAG TPA: TlpA disulfide reductase family protein [Vicinamibacterales bacterium]|jgi:peroxiredoxin
MTARWIIAAAAALGVGVLTVASLTGRPKPVVVDESPASAASDKATPVCEAESQANLNFTVKDMNGANVRLTDYKGKVILLNFWATWCAPCKAELPGFIELYAQYKDKGLVILGVSADDDAATLRSFASEWKLNYPVIVGRDETALLDAYGPIFGYPISVLVGRDGAVCGRHIGPATKEEFEREIKALL